MNEINADLPSDCTWCHGTGYIRRARSLSELNAVEWAIVLGGFLLILASVWIFGETHGFAVLVLVVIILTAVPLLQLVLGVGGVLGLIRRKEKCPHCSTKNGPNAAV